MERKEGRAAEKRQESGSAKKTRKARELPGWEKGRSGGSPGKTMKGGRRGAGGKKDQKTPLKKKGLKAEVVFSGSGGGGKKGERKRGEGSPRVSA
jgi:hypothetical protein